MKVSLEWIRDFSNYQGNIKDFVAGMTMSGSKVESYEIEGEGLSGLVTGLVKDCKDHPNSDHLHICQVDVGDQVLQIVCGAPNVAAGQKVIVATIGAELVGGFKIKKAKLRGVESNGMICSIDELGFSHQDFPGAAADGIYVLPEDTEVGLNALDVIGVGQELIEFEITSNRPDCLSVEGLARESAVTFKDDFKAMNKKPEAISQEKTEDVVKIRIEDEDLCSCFIGRLVTDVKIGPSPVWMQKRLRAAGMRPINNIVDITNFVMLSLGQPMHAYDLDYLADQTIIVRRAKAEEEMVLLDGREVKLNPDNLVIADKEKAVGLAGVMGAENSEVRETTKAILFESANFDRASVRRTSKEFNIRSEASLRFEKGLPVENAQRAIDYACYLVELLGCGKVSCSEIQLGKQSTPQQTVDFTTARLNNLIGLKLSDQEILAIFKSLEVGVEEGGQTGHYRALVPCFREDLQVEADLAEEVARIYGYDRIKGQFSKGNSPSLGVLSDDQKTIENIHRVMQAAGGHEVYSYSFVSPGNPAKLLLESDHPLAKTLTILNPLGEEYSRMRTTILASLLEIAQYNLAHGNQAGLIYEVGKTFHPRGLLGLLTELNSDRDQVLPDERLHLAILKFASNVADKTAGYFELKGIVEEVLDQLGIVNYSFRRPGKVTDYPFLHPGQSALIFIEDYPYPVGYIGRTHPRLKKNYGITDYVYTVDLDLLLLLKAKRKESVYCPLPKYPAVTRDLAFVLDQDILLADLEAEIKVIAGPLLDKIELFDIYQGKGIDPGKKSAAFALSFRSADRTLTDSDVNPVIEKVVSDLAKKDIQLRS